jgi:hypothetical protein
MQWVLHSKIRHVRITEWHEKDRMGYYAILQAQEFRKITYQERRNRWRWLTGNSKITEDDSLGPGQFRFTTSRNRPGPRKSSSVIWWRRKVILLNLKKGFDETSCLKSSSGDKLFRLVISRNWPGPGKSSSGDFKITVSDFGWTKSSQKSLSRTKLFYAPLVRLYH